MRQVSEKGKSCNYRFIILSVFLVWCIIHICDGRASGKQAYWIVMFLWNVRLRLVCIYLLLIYMSLQKTKVIWSDNLKKCTNALPYSALMLCWIYLRMWNFGVRGQFFRNCWINIETVLWILTSDMLVQQNSIQTLRLFGNNIQYFFKLTWMIQMALTPLHALAINVASRTKQMLI